jgi:hypothetical protein
LFFIQINMLFLVLYSDCPFYASGAKHPSCGTVALMVLGQFSDICGPWPVFWYLRLISENWPRTIRPTGPQISENWPKTIRVTVPNFFGVIFKLDSYFLFKLIGYFWYFTPIAHSMLKLRIHFRLALIVYIDWWSPWKISYLYLMIGKMFLWLYIINTQNVQTSLNIDFYVRIL